MAFTEHDNPLLDMYADLFINRSDAYMTRSTTSSWVCCRSQLPTDLLADAVAGRAILGLYSVDSVGCSKWVCLDLDDNARAHLMSRVIAQLDDPVCALLEASR